MFRALSLFAASALLALPASAQQSNTAITGTWLVEDGTAEITIAPCGNQVCGKISRVIRRAPDSNGRDQHNPDPELRNRPILGLPILTEMTRDDDLWRGRIYDPRGGDTYRSVVERKGANRLSVKGCIAFICKNQTWTRVQ
ncbi:DUF2147 domain-containing protein [Stakelama tenebrarum]|uniref:DUF2147 domain-containing protein n=1 Tax=Stakelama tenebrarum TaxID=2711215 RepID=A0A6G6Y3V5_9SPHN|nr:DUF2147 domain-containing protein [Sphingosinithalassobacter tenebrarum]QIG79293.1 DUF2147 domain-containing protein [Sphingosinithalassobacter tenebrarum]